MEEQSQVVEYTTNNAKTLHDKYSLKNIPGITYLNKDGSPLDHEVFDISSDTYFSEQINRLVGVQGRHLLTYSTMRGPNEFSPLLRVVGNKSHPNYVNNVKKFIKLLTDGSVPRETVERYLNHYIKSDNYGDVISYKPALYYGRMNGEYIKFLGKYGFNPNLPIITFDRTTSSFKVSANSLGLIDEDVGKYGIGTDKYDDSSDSSDSYEDIELTSGQRAASEALFLGANMQHRPEDVIERMYGATNIVNPRVRSVRQLYPYTFLSDKSHRHSLPDGDRMSSYNQFMDDQDRKQIELREPTTYLLQQLELLKPEQKLALAKFFEQTGIEGVDQLVDTLEDISRHHDSMNPHVTRDSSGRRMNTRYLKDKQGGGKKKTRRKMRYSKKRTSTKRKSKKRTSRRKVSRKRTRRTNRNRRDRRNLIGGGDDPFDDGGIEDDQGTGPELSDDDQGTVDDTGNDTEYIMNFEKCWKGDDRSSCNWMAKNYPERLVVMLKDKNMKFPMYHPGMKSLQPTGLLDKDGLYASLAKKTRKNEKEEKKAREKADRRKEGNSTIVERFTGALPKWGSRSNRNVQQELNVSPEPSENGGVGPTEKWVTTI